MSNVLPAWKKCCANCAFWSGEREIKHAQKTIVVKDGYVKGVCGHRNFAGARKSAGDVCPKFENLIK